MELRQIMNAVFSKTL